LIGDELSSLKDELEVLNFLQNEDSSATGMKELLKNVDESSPVFARVSRFNAETSKMKGGSKLYKSKLQQLKEDVRGDRETMDAVAKRIALVRRARKRANRRSERLEGFYNDTSVRDLIEKRSKPRWRNKMPDVFGNLGAETLKRSLFDPESEQISNEDSPPRKKAKKRAKSSGDQ
jgi:hypothetical protein